MDKHLEVNPQTRRMPNVNRTWALLLYLTAVGVGWATIRFVLPVWQPALSATLSGEEPKVYWYLARSSAVGAYVVLWFSMAYGLLLTGKLASRWPGAAAAADLHQFASLFGLLLALFHAVILTGDRYIQYTLTQVLLPFAAQSYKPLEVGFGQLSFYLWGMIFISFYLRKHIGTRTWRAFHLISFLTYGMALYHGIAAGTDTGTTWASILYWLSGGTILFLLIYRLIVRFYAVGRPAAAARRG